MVATVNGKEIARAELERNYQIQLGDNPQKPSDQEADILRLNVLQKMILSEIEQQQAAKLNLTASDEDVNTKLTRSKLRIPRISSTTCSSSATCRWTI